MRALTSGFNDHFSGFSSDYCQYRPRYPQALFAYLASVCDRRQRAWDCATGTGQAATGLAEYFPGVIATDASDTQVRSAEKRENIDYRLAPAERSGIENESIDLITVAQAIHWFDLDAFRNEVERVLRRGGILAVWSYGLPSTSPDIDRVVNHLYGPVLDQFWPGERRLIEAGYKDIDFPYEKIDTPAFAMSSKWALAGLVGYLNTWSAVKKYIEQRKTSPVEAVFDDLSAAWGAAETVYEVVWPMTLLVWRK